MNGLTTRYVYDGLQAIAEIQGRDTSTLLTALGLDEVIARYTSAGQNVPDRCAQHRGRADARRPQHPRTSMLTRPTARLALGADEGNPIQYTARENDRTGLSTTGRATTILCSSDS